MRLFISSRGLNDSSVPDCGIREVEFTLGLEGSAVWSDVEYHDPGTSCDLAPIVTRGLTLSRDGNALLTYGGRSDGDTSDGGGICAIDLTSYVAEQAIDAADLAMYVRALYPHPHLENVYFVGGITSADCPGCSIPGLYGLERRYRPDTDTWTWKLDMLSGDDMEHPQVNTITWGSAGGDDLTMTDLFVGTAGGGALDGLLTW